MCSFRLEAEGSSALRRMDRRPDWYECVNSVHLLAQVQLQIVAPPELQFVEHMMQVDLHRADADRQACGDLLVVQTGGDQPQDLELARGQDVLKLLLDVLPLRETIR